jgi:hypothetical protein
VTLSPGSRAWLQVSDAEAEGLAGVTWLKRIFGEAAEGQDSLEKTFKIDLNSASAFMNISHFVLYC